MTESDQPIHPVLLLAANPTTGYTWLKDNSLIEGMTVESEFIPAPTDGPLVGARGMEKLILIGEKDLMSMTRFSYAREWEEGSPFLTISIKAECWENTEVEIVEMYLSW